MREIAADLRRWLDRSEPVALATVVATRGPSPRPLGARLAVSASGELAGSVSGGCVEVDVARAAGEVLAGGRAQLLSYGIADERAWEVGLPCGGEIDVFLERLRPELAELLAELAESGQRAVVLTVLDGDRAGTRLALTGDGRALGDADGGLASLASSLRCERGAGVLDTVEGRVFYQVLAPPPRLLVVGAVDLAEALCRLADSLGWQTVVADPRARFATRERIPSAHELVLDWPEQALERVAPDADTAVVVLTHEERFDTPALVGALASDAFYVGALGSRRNQERRRERLRAAGVGEQALARLRGPCGVAIGAVTPGEIAVSILAEAISELRGGELPAPTVRVG